MVVVRPQGTEVVIVRRARTQARRRSTVPEGERAGVDEITELVVVHADELAHVVEQTAITGYVAVDDATCSTLR